MPRFTLTAEEIGQDKAVDLSGDFEVYVSPKGGLSVYDRSAKGAMSSGLVFAAPAGMWRNPSIAPRATATRRA